MRSNSMKNLLRENKLALGGIARCPHPAIVEAMGYAGLSWVLIDCEHGSISSETIETMCMYAYAVGISPIVRVGSPTSDAEVMRALDLGSAGVIVPRIETVAQAELIAQVARYPPNGIRGAGPTRTTHFGAIDAQEAYRRSNEEVLVVLLIEQPEAVECIDAIASVEGIDALMVGPGDLSSALGIPYGQSDHPVLNDAIMSIKRAARNHGKWLFTGVRMLKREDFKKYLDYDALLIGIDLYFLRQAFADLAEPFQKARQQIPERPE